MTYYIETEKGPGEGRNEIMIRSLIKTRRKNVGTPQEFTNNIVDAELLLDPVWDSRSDLIGVVETVEEEPELVEDDPIESNPIEMFPPDLEETLPTKEQPDITPEEVEALYAQFDSWKMMRITTLTKL